MKFRFLIRIKITSYSIQGKKSNRPKDQKPTTMLFGADGTDCFAGKTSRDYENEKPSPFLKKFIRQSQSSIPEPEPEHLKQ